MTRIKKDKIHYSSRKIDSYNKPFNFITSEREGGKTTAIVATKVYKAWRHEHRPSIILRRNTVDITETYIDDLCDTINDFLPDSSKIQFEYKRTMSSGIVDVKVNGTNFCRFMSMSCKKGRIKSLHYDDPKYMFLDEFIIDVDNGEKYLQDEANKFKEIYNTFLRFATRYNHTLKCYFCGNPYSVYNPYYVWLGVDLNKIRPGAFIVGKNYVIECYQITQELREWILARNPLYEFDDSYTRYAFGGIAVNDINFQIVDKQPEGYKLKHVFRISSTYLAFYYRSNKKPGEPGLDWGKFWVTKLDKVGDNRKMIAVDFNNLVQNSTLITSETKMLVIRLKYAIAERDVTYQSMDCAYLTKAIYQLIK